MWMKVHSPRSVAKLGTYQGGERDARRRFYSLCFLR